MFIMPRKSKLNLPSLNMTKEKSIGQQILRLRKEKGLTQDELAKKIGIIQRLVSDYEHDNLRLNAEMLVRFAKALGVNTDEILGIKISTNEDSPRNLRISKRLKKIESLPVSQQNVIIKTLDAFLKASEK